MPGTVPALRHALKRHVPGLSRERVLWGSGAGAVAGVDEAGRGAWAGPLAVGAAVLPVDRRVYKVRDSKMLTEEEREALFGRIAGWCRAWAVGMATAAECDRLGMAAAQRLAAQRALAGLGLDVDRALVDGPWDFVGGGIGETVVRGDATCLSIAAASILAKVTRDRLMRAESLHFPWYGFAGNKGYPSPEHRAALHWLGPSPLHRRSWSSMDGLPWRGMRLPGEGGVQGTLPGVAAPGSPW